MYINLTVFRKNGPSIPKRAASPPKKMAKMFYVIGLHFGTGIIDVSLTHFISKRPIIHGVR